MADTFSPTVIQQPIPISDTDIRAGCLGVVERMDLTEEQDSAVFNAAVAAIREAEQRLSPAG